MKKISDSVTTQTHLIRYQHLNGQRRLFGGMLMQWIDELAGTVARRHTGGEVITAAVDSLVFKEPGFLGDLVVMSGRITHVGTTSMEVQVDTYVEKCDGQRNLINQAYLVMVALDEDGRPAAVPAVTPQTPEEEEAWRTGQKRYELRRQRRRENF